MCMFHKLTGLDMHVCVIFIFITFSQAHRATISPTNEPVTIDIAFRYNASIFVVHDFHIK